MVYFDILVSTMYNNKMRRMKIIGLLLLLPILLAGCLNWETEELSVHLNDDGGGTFSIKFGPIGSDEETPELRDEDFAYFIYEVIQDSTHGAPELTEVKGKILEEGGGIFAEITGSFSSLTDIEKHFELPLSSGEFTYLINRPNALIETNGGTTDTDEGKLMLYWPKDTALISYKVHVAESQFITPYKQKHSLLPLYKKYLKDKNYFKKIYEADNTAKR